MASPIIDPFIRRYNGNGRVTADLPIPDKYIPNGVDCGVRFNLSFESLNPTPNGRKLITAERGHCSRRPRLDLLEWQFRSHPRVRPAQARPRLSTCTRSAPSG